MVKGFFSASGREIELRQIGENVHAFVGDKDLGYISFIDNAKAKYESGITKTKLIKLTRQDDKLVAYDFSD